MTFKSVNNDPHWCTAWRNLGSGEVRYKLLKMPCWDGLPWPRKIDQYRCQPQTTDSTCSSCDTLERQWPITQSDKSNALQFGSCMSYNQRTGTSYSLDKLCGRPDPAGTSGGSTGGGGGISAECTAALVPTSQTGCTVSSPPTGAEMCTTACKAATCAAHAACGDAPLLAGWKVTAESLAAVKACCGTTTNLAASTKLTPLVAALMGAAVARDS